MSEVTEEAEAWSRASALPGAAREAAGGVQRRADHVRELAADGSVKSLHDWTWDTRRAFARFREAIPPETELSASSLERCERAFRLVDAFLRGETAIGELDEEEDE